MPSTARPFVRGEGDTLKCHQLESIVSIQLLKKLVGIVVVMFIAFDGCASQQPVATHVYFNCSKSPDEVADSVETICNDEAGLVTGYIKNRDDDKLSEEYVLSYNIREDIHNISCEASDIYCRQSSNAFLLRTQDEIRFIFTHPDLTKDTAEKATKNLCVKQENLIWQELYSKYCE